MKTPQFEPERRTIDLTLERRGEGDSRTIRGYAAVFDSLSRNLGWFREKIDKKAFDDTDMTDVVAVLNHDFNILFARSSSKTLTLGVDEKGLYYEFDAPKTTAGNDLLEMVSRGDINRSSFQFVASRDMWEQDDEAGEIRTILAVKRLIDVSPVTMAAYPDTTVAKRSHDAFQTEEGEQKKDGKVPASVQHAEAEFELMKIKNH